MAGHLFAFYRFRLDTNEKYRWAVGRQNGKIGIFYHAFGSKCVSFCATENFRTDLQPLARIINLFGI